MPTSNTLLPQPWHYLDDVVVVVAVAVRGGLAIAGVLPVVQVIIPDLITCFCGSLFLFVVTSLLASVLVCLGAAAAFAPAVIPKP